MAANTVDRVGDVFSRTSLRTFEHHVFSEVGDSTFVQGLDDQYSVELFYRLQLSQNFAITPDVQVIMEPALDPGEDVLGVFGMRARLTF